MILEQTEPLNFKEKLINVNKTFFKVSNCCYSPHFTVCIEQVVMNM